jgi:hypothetical protein
MPRHERDRRQQAGERDAPSRAGEPWPGHGGAGDAPARRATPSPAALAPALAAGHRLLDPLVRAVVPRPRRGSGGVRDQRHDHPGVAPVLTIERPAVRPCGPAAPPAGGGRWTGPKGAAGIAGQTSAACLLSTRRAGLAPSGQDVVPAGGAARRRPASLSPACGSR